MTSTKESTVDIFPKNDGACVKVSFSNGTWIKHYQSMTDATTDAVNLGLMRDSEKNLVDLSQRMPNYHHDLQTKAQVELLALEKSGFHPE
jgi:hypothetical protein